MDNIKQQLADIIMDTLPDEHPWAGRVCDLVDALIANRVTVQEWIPVAERLPKESGIVLGYDRVLGVSPCYFHADMISSAWQSVTHWMPLPTPPKGESDDVSS